MTNSLTFNGYMCPCDTEFDIVHPVLANYKFDSKEDKIAYQRYHNEAYQLYEQKCYYVAAELFGKARAVNTRLGESLHNVLVCLKKLEWYEAILEFFERFNLVTQDQTLFFCIKGEACFKTGSYDNAESLYLQALKVNRFCCRALVSLSQLYFKQNRFDDVKNILDQVKEINPYYTIIYKYYAQLAFAQNDVFLGREYLYHYVNWCEDDLPAKQKLSNEYYEVAKHNIRCSQIKAAINCLNSAIKHNRNHEKAWVDLIALVYFWEDLQTAYALLDKFNQFQTKPIEMHLILKDYNSRHAAMGFSKTQQRRLLHKTFHD